MTLNPKYIAGVDEVGRGCLFGPVFAGAVILSELASSELLSAGLKDSKVLTARKRAYLVPLIEKSSLAWGLGQSSAREIDNFGIRTATELAMIRALQRLPKQPKMVLVDGNLPLRLWSGDQINLIRGECHAPAIAAASILAKEARDQLIKRLATRHPNYGLNQHVGYGTAIHKQALKSLGLTPLHRRTFLSKFLS